VQAFVYTPGYEITTEQDQRDDDEEKKYDERHSWWLGVE
jgi:hypothetical protein